MNVINKATFPIIVMCWDEDFGYGDEMTIQPDKSGTINGPYVGDGCGKSWYLEIKGEITVHEEPNNESGYHVSKGNQLSLAREKSGVSVRHYSDALKIG